MRGRGRWTGPAVGGSGSGAVQVNLDDGSVHGPGGLLERLGQLPDPRGRRGRRHPLPGLLVIAAVAVLAGARSFAAIGQLSRKLPQATLARLGTWQRPYSTWHVAPSETTLRSVLQQLDADELDRVVGGWLAEQAAAGRGPIAVDGKVLRVARQPGGHQVHLAGRVVTADALCGDRDNASYVEVVVMPRWWAVALLLG